MNFAIIVAIEDYAEDEWSHLPFSLVGASGFSEVLAANGVSEENQHLLLNSSASKTIIESRIRRLTAELTADDMLFFYYHGYLLNQNGDQRFTCFDTQISDIAATTLSITSLIKTLQQSDCRLAMFLNGGDLSVALSDDRSPDSKDISAEQGLAGQSLVEECAPFTAVPLKKNFAKKTNQAIFGAFDQGEQSHANRKIKNNIWAVHLCSAFSGLAQDSLDSSDRLLASLLQTNLEQAVDSTLREVFSKPKEQTPWFAGDANMVLAELATLVDERKLASPVLTNAGQIGLVRQREIDIRNLTGFQKSHKVPDTIDDRSFSFVGRLAKEDIALDLDTAFKKLKTAYRFKRVDMQVDVTDEGFGSIRTPHFDYSISITQSQTDPSAALFRKEVTNIRQAEQVFSEPFDAVFAADFDTLEYSAVRRIDVEELIDRIEQLDDESFHLEYEHDATWCDLTIDEIEATFHITSEKLEIVKRQPVSPAALVEIFMAMKTALVDGNQNQILILE